jgi:cytoskeletal protein RodZ
MQTLGQRLRAEREKKGLSIPELANRTRIRAPFFEAIEADKPEQFPGRFFYRSFLRQYADMLGLPESAVQPEIEQSITEELAEKADREARVQGFKPEVPPLPTGRINVREETRRWMTRLSVLLGVLILCSGVYFFWQRWGQRMFDDSWRSVVRRPAQSAPNPKPPARRAEASTTVVPSPAPSANSAPTPAAPAETTVLPPAAQTSPKVESPPPGVVPHGKIEIRALGFCWVGGWRDGKQFLSSTLPPGEVRIVEGGGAVRLQFGSSGDVAIKVDGNAIQPIGAKGERRTLEYHDGVYRLLNRIPATQTKP